MSPAAFAQTEALSLAVEKRLGIKANEDDLEKLRTYLWDTYRGESPDVLNRVFDSGEAAVFLTVNETYFFREPAHFNFLREQLPSFKGFLRICSAATSTGCEAYSIAMLIEDCKRRGEPVAYHIDAFDINPRVIETAEKGIYGRHSLREDGSCFRYMADPFLVQEGDEYRVDPSLKKNIRFFVHNIMDALPSVYDLIFFRNAFIYFSQGSRVRLLSNLADALADGGLLVVGVSETAGVRHPAFDDKNRDDMFYFQKTREAERRA